MTHATNCDIRQGLICNCGADPWFPKQPELTSFDRLARLEQKLGELAGYCQVTAEIVTYMKDSNIQASLENRLMELHNLVCSHGARLDAGLKGVSDGCGIGFAQLLKAIGAWEVRLGDLGRSLDLLARKPRRAKKKR